MKLNWIGIVAIICVMVIIVAASLHHIRIEKASNLLLPAHVQAENHLSEFARTL